MHLIPRVKQLETKEGYLITKMLQPVAENPESRLMAAMKHFTFSETGTPFYISISGSFGESYEIDIAEEKITANFTKTQKQELEEYTDLYCEYSSILQEIASTYGMRLGMKILLEALTNN